MLHQYILSALALTLLYCMVGRLWTTIGALIRLPVRRSRLSIATLITSKKQPSNVAMFNRAMSSHAAITTNQPQQPVVASIQSARKQPGFDSFYKKKPDDVLLPRTATSLNASNSSTSTLGSQRRQKDSLMRSNSQLAEALTEEDFDYDSPARTSNPLATNKGHNPSRNGFKFCSQEYKRNITNSADKSQRMNGGNDTYFDEHDFSSDVELELHDLTTQGTIKYPSLPGTSHTPASGHVDYPQLPVLSQRDGEKIAQSSSSWSVNNRGSNTEVKCHTNSSAAFTWSSSPPAHFGPPPGAWPRESAVGTRTTSRINTNGGSESPAKSRPAKRRRLPWSGEKPTPCDTSEAANEPVSKRARAGNASITHGQLTSDIKEHVSAYKHRAPYPVSEFATKSKFRQQVPNLPPLPKLQNAPPAPQGPPATKVHQPKKNQKQMTVKFTRAAEANTSAKQKKPTTTGPKPRVPRPFLSEEQEHVRSLVIDRGKSIFFTGSAGTGKSVLLREIIASLRQKHARDSDRVAVTASTGLAACNIGGVTLHSFSGIGLGKESAEELVKKIRKNQKARQRWLRTKVLIMDEVSMVDGELFDKLEQIARTIRANGRPFGGIQLVMTGDFFQLPPVPENGKPIKFAFDAGSWNTSIEYTIKLTKVFRQKEPEFANMLNEMREGTISEKTVQTFQRLSRDLENLPEGQLATELFSTRNEVDRANNTHMHRLAGQPHVFEARDAGTANSDRRNRLLANCMAPPILQLKVGAQVMLIKNIDESLVNGSIGQIIDFMSETDYARQFEGGAPTEKGMLEDEHDDDDVDARKLRHADRSSIAHIKARLDRLAASTGQKYPLVHFPNADGTTRTVLLHREPWKVELPNGEIEASRSQVPLILAWALSIHKAQGQTMDFVKVDLGKVFERGQAYVALSRATSISGLQVMRFDPRRVTVHDRVKDFYLKLKGAEQITKQENEVVRGNKKKMQPKKPLISGLDLNTSLSQHPAAFAQYQEGEEDDSLIAGMAQY